MRRLWGEPADLLPQLGKLVLGEKHHHVPAVEARATTHDGEARAVTARVDAEPVRAALSFQSMHAARMAEPIPAKRVTSFVGARLPFVTAATAQPVVGSAHASVLKLPAWP